LRLVTQSLPAPRLCKRIDAGRPHAHVADEGGISRATLTKWYKRWLLHGDPGLLDRTSRPDYQPTRTPDDIEEVVLQLRTVEKWGPDRIAGYLATVGDGSIKVSLTGCERKRRGVQSHPARQERLSNSGYIKRSPFRLACPLLPTIR
jgi:hypothetical protein